MPRIRRLDVQGFRGIRQPASLLFEGKSVLLFGENGTGKSSFVDALERTLTGKVSTLDGRLGLSTDRHGPHIRGQQYPMQIAITFDDPGSSILDLRTNAKTLSVPAQQYLEAARENLYILRRRQILDFIERQPRERYDVLRPFLPLSGVEAAEEALRQARDRAERAALVAKEELNRLVQELRRELVGRGLSPDPSEQEVVAALNQELTALGQPPITDVADMGEPIGRLTGALSSFGDLTRQSRLTSATRSLEELAESLRRIDMQPLVGAVDALRERQAQEIRVLYEAVLEQGIKWIEQESRAHCPLCEQPINAVRVVGHARERLNAAREVLELRQRARQALESIRQVVRSAVEATERTASRLTELAEEERLEVAEPVAAARRFVTDLEKTLRQDPTGLNMEGLRSYSAAESEAAAIVPALARCQDALRGRLSGLPSPEAAQKLLSLRHRIERVSQVWPSFGQARKAEKEAAQHAATTRAVFEHAQAARKEELQLLFDELSKDVDEIYARVNPGESHGGVRLEIREAVQRSVNLRADFYDRQGEDPRAYYSDAHLDTLGLSIFLALRRWYRRQEPDFDLLVLDDVLSSVDAAHAVRFSETLLSEFGDYQIFLTTHDRIWFEHLRDIQARCGVAQVFVNKIIHGWRIDEGPDLREPEDERQAIEGLIVHGSAEQIAAMAGRLLEHVLQEMRYALRLSVQAKRGEQYEIGELWPVFCASAKREYPALYERGRATLEALDVSWPVRNWVGAHWNTWARNVPRRTAVEFAMAVRDLFDLVFCPSCRRFITPSVSPLGQLACRCGGKIYPAPGKQAVSPRSREDLVRATQATLRDAQLDTTRYFEWKRAEAGRER